jgi:hypothetical protein
MTDCRSIGGITRVDKIGLRWLARRSASLSRSRRGQSQLKTSLVREGRVPACRKRSHFIRGKSGLARIGQDLRERYQFPKELPPMLLSLIRKLDALEGNAPLCATTREQLPPRFAWQRDADLFAG